MLQLMRKRCSPLVTQLFYFSSRTVIEPSRKMNPKPFCTPKLDSCLWTTNCSYSDTSTSTITNINSEQLKKFIDLKNALVIDVRTREEIAATGVLPTSYNIPLDELSNAFVLTPEEFLQKYKVSKPDLDQKIVFSCAKGIRSLKACRHVADLGYKNLFNYVEGWFGWEAHK